MKLVRYAWRALAILALLVIGLGGTMLTVVAQVDIPSDATIDQATLFLFVRNSSGQTVNVHRITSDWTESTVTWNSFGGAFDSGVEGTFVAASGWQSVDVTALVQAWVDGTYPNYGLLLEQGETEFAKYSSSEWDEVALRPQLEICYTAAGSGSTCVTVQRGTFGDIADAYITSLAPDLSGGAESVLWTGFLNGGQKQSLFRFDIEVLPPPCGEGCTPGFWKNHLDAWPDAYSPGDSFNDTFGVSVFADDFSLEDAANAKGGGWNALARHATAALLGAGSLGDYPYTVDEVITLVQGAAASGDLGAVEAIKDELDAANNLGCPLR